MRRRPGNIGLRIFALAFSILLWLMAPRPESGTGDGSAFVERPFVATIAVRGLDEGLEVVDMQEWATLHLRGVGVGPSLDIDRVQVYVDLSGRGAGTHQVPVTVIPPFGIQVREIDPESITVRLEQVLQRTLPVRVATLGMPPGTRVVVLGTEPAEVQVEGTVGELQRLAELIAWVRLPERAGLHTVDASVEPVDARGTVLSGIAVRPEKVSVSIEIIVEESSAETIRSEVEPNGA